MTIQQLINDLQNAINVHHFDPKASVQINVITYDGRHDDTCWNISVDGPARFDPRSLVISADEHYHCDSCDTILNYSEGDRCCWCEQRAKDKEES